MNNKSGLIRSVLILLAAVGCVNAGGLKNFLKLAEKGMKMADKLQPQSGQNPMGLLQQLSAVAQPPQEQAQAQAPPVAQPAQFNVPQPVQYAPPQPPPVQYAPQQPPPVQYAPVSQPQYYAPAQPQAPTPQQQYYAPTPEQPHYYAPAQAR